jgi:hypothetical protein
MENQTAREILSQFYKDNNYGHDGGLTSSTVKLEFSPWFHLYFPNFNSRRKALIKHDIHHLVTGYDTTVKGESEISAWEIGSGCKNYRAAFFIDTSGTMMGILLNFRSVLRAFSRGRKTKNLYHDLFTPEQELDMKIDEIQKHLMLDKYPINTRPGIADLASFCGFALFGMFYSILLLPVFPFIILYSLYIGLKKNLVTSEQ